MTLEEINELVNEIQQLLVSDAEASEEELMDLAGRHEDYVVETTKWLKSVDALLQKGLRSEAIELAEREPNLNEVVIALDFPELDAWNDLLAKHEMQPIPALPEGIAADLNDAYGVSAPVERLLQKHRTAALARAPLAHRLQILRRLAVADKDNPAWPQDIREFEKFRLTEVRNDLDAAIRDRRLETLSAIDNELQAEDWTLAVPVELRKKASDAHSKVRKEASKAEMEGLAYQLSDTFAEFDLPSAKGLFNRFNALNQIVGLSQSDALMDIAGPALDWVKAELLKEEQEQHYQRSIAAMEAGIDNGAPAAELERLYYEATRHDHVLPERLQLRLNDRLETLRVMAQRRRRTVIGATIAGVIVLLVATGFTIQQVRVRNSISRHKTQLAALFEEGEKTGLIQPLQEYFDLLSTEPASISQSAELVGLKQQFETLRLKEDGRKKKIEELLAQTTVASENAKVPSDFRSAFESLKSAESQALNDTERTAILKVEVAVREKQTSIQKITDDAFQEKVRDLTARAESLPNDDVAPYEVLQSEISALVRTPDVSPGLIDSVRSMQSKVQAESLEVRKTLEIARSLLGVSGAIGNADAYLSELRKFAEQYPGSGRATDFSRVVETERELLIGALRWNSIRSKLLGIDFRKITAAQAKAIVDDYSDFQRTSGPYPGDMELNDRLLMLQAVVKRKLPVDGMKLVFDGKAIMNAFIIETPDGRERYYADSAPIVDKGLTFDSYTTPSGDQTVNRKLGSTMFPDVADKPRDSWLAPQTRLAKSLIERAETNGEEDFENMIRVAIERLITEEPKLDPILRMLLVERVLEYGSEGSHFVGIRSRKILAGFAEAGVPRLTNWVNYSEIQNRKLRDVATDFLQKNSAAIQEIAKGAEADRDAASSLKIGPELRWIGWLSREDRGSGSWQIRTKINASFGKGGDVVTIARRTPTEKPQQVKVATCNSAGVISIVENIETLLPVEGRAAFLVISRE